MFIVDNRAGKAVTSEVNTKGELRNYQHEADLFAAIRGQPLPRRHNRTPPPRASTGGRGQRRRSYFGVNIPVDAPSIVIPLASLF